MRTSAHGPGDVNGDTSVDVSDVFYLLNYLFAHGPAPLASADVNGNGNVDIADVFYLINFLFAGGPVPVPDRNPPYIVYTDPYDRAPGVPRNVVGRIRFSEVMDPESMSSSTLPIWDLILDAEVPCALEKDADGRTVRLTPTQPLAAGHTYAFRPNLRALQDLAGNPIDEYYVPGDSDIFFVVGFELDGTPPVVTGSYPADGATGLLTNAGFVVSFSEIVGDIDIERAFSVDGAPATYAWQFTTEHRARVSFTAPFAPNSSHTLTVQGLRDLAGNVMTEPWVMHFTTGPTGDTVSASATWNVANSSSVPADFHPRLHFTKPVLPDSLYMFSRAGDWVLDSSRTNATFSPSSPGFAGQSFRALAMDDGGHFVFTNTLHASPNAVVAAPAVLDVTPPAGAAGVPVNARIAARLSGAVDPTSLGEVVVSTGGSPVPAIVSLQAGAVVVAPEGLLATSTEYTVALEGLVDTYGRTVPASSWSFTTGASGTPDSIAPAFLGSVPAGGASNVDPSSAVVLTFSEPMSTVGAAVSATYVPASGKTVWPGHVTAGGNALTFTPTVPFPPGTTITFDPITALDLGGNASAPASVSFGTAGAPDISPPAIVSVDLSTLPGRCDTAVLHLSKPVAPFPNQTDVEAVLYSDFQRVISQGSVTTRSADGLALTISCGFANGPSMVALTSNVKDPGGNAADPAAGFPFNAPVYEALGSTLIRPADGSVNVPPETPFAIFAARPFDPSTVEAGVHVTVNGEPVTGNFAVDGRTIVFTPTSPLPPGALVELFVTSDFVVTDGFLIGLYPAHSSFRVTPSPTAPAVVLAATPAVEEDVPTNAVLRVRYSRALDPSSVAAAVSLTSGDVPLAGTASLVAPDVVEFTPSEPLPPNAPFTLTHDGLKDMDGALVEPFSRSFGTASGPDDSPAAFARVSPPDGASDVPTNVVLWAAWDGRLDAVSLSNAVVALETSGVTVPARAVAHEDRIEIVPFLPLAPASPFSLSISGLLDETGKPAAPVSTSFTTASGVDLHPPVVTRIGLYSQPPNAPTEVAVEAPFATARLTPAGMSIFQPGTLTFSGDGLVARFYPSGGWEPLSFVYVGADVRTFGDEPYAYSYDTESYVSATPQSLDPPSVAAADPPNAATGVVRGVHPAVTFAEPISAELSGAVQLSGPGGSLDIHVSVGDKTLTVLPRLPLAPNTAYTLTLTGVKSLLGVPTPSPIVLSFTTGPGF
jgi:Bacterial Ig-like domain/Dockerin type I domain